MIKRKFINKKAKREIDRYPLVSVRWSDVVSDSAWNSLSAIAKAKLPVCITKGHLFTQAKGITRVFGDFVLKNEETGEIDEIGNATLIPNCLITEMKKIKD
jgi:hypothetical protein